MRELSSSLVEKLSISCTKDIAHFDTSKSLLLMKEYTGWIVSNLKEKLYKRWYQSTSLPLNWNSSTLISIRNYRTERFYYLGFSLGKIIDLGNAINTVSILNIDIHRFIHCYNCL